MADSTRRTTKCPRVCLMLPSLLVALIASAGCGGAGGAERDHAATGGDNTEVRSVSRQAPDERCPRVLPPGRMAARSVLRAVPREIRRAYRNIDRKDYILHALFALDPREFAVGLRRSRYVRVAARGCGRETATQSWVAVFGFPRAPSAALGSAAASFFARTETGWRIWYVWYPAMGDGGFPP